MALVCGEITADILRDCDALPTGGVKSMIRVGNLEDVATWVKDATNPLILTDIVMKTGKKMFKYEVFKRGHKPRFEKVNGEFGDKYRHVVDTSIQVWDNDTKAQVEGLNGSSVFVIVENLQNSGDARFEVYGFDQGLYVGDGAVRNLAENDGVYSISLTGEDGYLESHIPYSFWDTSYAATLTALATLDVVAGTTP
jgi:hypothetical protein